MSLKSDAAVPLYLQLTQKLRDEITGGVYRPGERIPTELALSRLYGVSRITVRNALKELARDELLVRRQGKGTFVADTKIKRDITHITSFTQLCLATGQTPGAKTIKSMLEPATELDCKELNLEPGSRVIVLERIRYADAVPVAIESSRLPERFMFLLNENLNDASLISILSERHNIAFTSSSYKCIRLVYATYEQSKYLSLSNGYPLIAISSLSCDAQGTPCHRSLQLIVGDKFELYL